MECTQGEPIMKYTKDIQNQILRVFIRGKWLEWVEYAWRSNDIIKEVMIGTINGKRPRGRQGQKTIDIVKSDLKECAPGTKLEVCRQK